MQGAMLKALGNYEEALPLLRQGLDVFDTGANKEHPEVARTLHELGEVYGKLAMLAESREALTRAFAIRSKILGPDHPDTRLTESLRASLTATGGALAEVAVSVKV